MNDIPQTIAKAGNPSIKYPPNVTQSVPFSRPNVGYQGSPLVDSWAESPQQGSSILKSNNGLIDWLGAAPSGGTYVLGSIGGQIQWIATENCDA
jgi:hypothetical protein